MDSNCILQQLAVTVTATGNIAAALAVAIANANDACISRYIDTGKNGSNTGSRHRKRQPQARS